MKRLQLKDGKLVKPAFVAFTKQYKDDVRKIVCQRIATLIAEMEGTPTEDENAVLDVKPDLTYTVEVANIHTEDELIEPRTIDRIEVDCGGNVYVYSREEPEEETELTELDTDTIFGIGIFVDELYYKVCTNS